MLRRPPRSTRTDTLFPSTTLFRADVVLLRTGKGASFRHPDAYKRDPAAITLETAMFLAGQGAMVVGVDLINPEPLPSNLEDNYLPVHTFLIGEQGIPIIENLDLERLARDRIYEFAFVGTPLKIEGASGAPIRSEEHTSELQSLMRISYAVFCLKKQTTTHRA